MKTLAVTLVLLSSSAAYAQEDPWFRRAGEEALSRETVEGLNQMFPSVGQARAAFAMQLRERQRAAEQSQRRAQ